MGVIKKPRLELVTGKGGSGERLLALGCPRSEGPLGDWMWGK